MALTLAIEASSGRARVFRPSPMVTYEPSSYSRSHTYAITDAAGSIEPKTIKLSWTWPERLDFTLEGRYDTKSPHLTETYKRVFREIETASNKAAVQHTQKTMPLVEEKQSLKAVRAPKKLASLIDLVETDATSKKVAVHYPMKTIQLSKDMQSLNIEEPLKKLEPSNDLIDMKAAGKSYAVQHPKQTTQLVEKTQPLKAVKAFKKLEPSKDLVETDAAGKKAAFQHLKKTTQLEEIQPVKAAKPCKELEPVKCMVETSDASKKYAAQYPKKTVPLVEEAQPFKTAKPRNDQEYLKNQVSKEVREVGATIETPHKANVTPNPTEAEASKRRAATKKTQSSQKAKRDEEAEWDIIDSTDDEEKDKDWVEVSGRDLMAEKNEPMGWAGTMKRWFG